MSDVKRVIFIVADDDSDHLDLMRRVIEGEFGERENCLFSSFTTAERALEEIEMIYAFDKKARIALTTDLNFRAQKDGFWLLQQVRDLDLPVLVVSSMRKEAWRQQLLERIGVEEPEICWGFVPKFGMMSGVGQFVQKVIAMVDGAS
jgi:hypothetical protein